MRESAKAQDLFTRPTIKMDFLICPAFPFGNYSETNDVKPPKFHTAASLSRAPKATNKIGGTLHK